jgi:hypothetical protein
MKAAPLFTGLALAAGAGFAAAAAGSDALFKVSFGGSFLLLIVLCWKVVFENKAASLEPRLALLFFGPLKPGATLAQSRSRTAMWFIVAFIAGLLAGAAWAVNRA